MYVLPTAVIHYKLSTAGERDMTPKIYSFPCFYKATGPFFFASLPKYFGIIMSIMSINRMFINHLYDPSLCCVFQRKAMTIMNKLQHVRVSCYISYFHIKCPLLNQQNLTTFKILFYIWVVFISILYYFGKKGKKIRMMQKAF